MAGLLSIGARAMTANQAALNTISQNIANANTPGYSRQSVVFKTSDGQQTGAGFFGRGVDVQTVVRAHNEFLTREAATAKATSSQDATRLTQLNRLQKLFPTGSDGIGFAANQFFNSMIDVTSRPADPSARQVALGYANDLASRFSSAGQQLDDLQAGVVSDLTAEVNVVNEIASQIAKVNDQIAATRGSGHSPNDLLDKREQLISTLSEHVAVSTLTADDGTVGVFIGGGQRLVLGNQAQRLQVDADSYDATKAVLSLNEGGQLRPLDESVLTGGVMTALLTYQNKDLSDARNLLGQMAAALGTRVNDQNALGLDLSTPAGKGGPIFNVAAPRVQAANSNQRNPDGSFTNGVVATIVDASQLQASDYKLTVNAGGGYNLTRLSDGVTKVVNDGDSVDGFKISFAPNPPTGTDSYIIQPVGAAALNMRRVLDVPSGLAAAAPITANLAVNNTGTLSIDSLYAVNNKLDVTKAPMTLAFGAPDPAVPGNVLYTLTLSDSTVLNGSWAAGQPIGNQPAAGIDLGFELRTNGVPRNGDVVTLAPTLYTNTNNSNAKAFLLIQSDTFIGRRLQPDGSLGPGSTVSDAYAASMSEIGSRVQGATYLASVSEANAKDAENERSSQAGVNLDEEAARLIQYQQSYQAAAKVMQTAQTIFNELMRVAGAG